tara:strand:- start:20561 stop:21319 length:759 start_codon:yes stop_codon:yes gene_type:complete
MLNDKLKREIESFQDLWKGGSNPSKMGWTSAVEALAKRGTYVEKIVGHCITPYITPEACVLDIGTNGGFWLLPMQDAKEIIGMDVLPPDHLNFWSNINSRMSSENAAKVKFKHVADFSCRELSDDSLDLVYSYDVFCHISLEGTVEYLRNLYPKMKKGAHAFIMIADDTKYPRDEIGMKGRNKLMLSAGFTNWETFVEDDGEMSQCSGRWYFYGRNKFGTEAEKLGYEVVALDCAEEMDRKCPIVHLRKPLE